MRQGSDLCGWHCLVADSENAKVFTRSFDEYEQAVTIVQGEVFSRGLDLSISLLVRGRVMRAMTGSLP